MSIPYGYNKPPRNSVCWCGSGVKSKKCHPEAPPKTLVLISGAPCAGKSSVRSSFCELLPEPYSEIDYDALVKNIIDKNQLPEERYGTASSEARRLIVQQALHTITVSDPLCDNNKIREMQHDASSQSVCVFSILLHCDREIRRARDEARYAENPDAPHGFIDGMVPEPNQELFDLIINTGKLNPAEVAQQMYQAISQSIWKVD